MASKATICYSNQLDSGYVSSYSEAVAAHRKDIEENNEEVDEETADVVVEK